MAPPLRGSCRGEAVTEGAKGKLVTDVGSYPHTRPRWRSATLSRRERAYPHRPAATSPKGEARPHIRRFAATGYGVLATGKHLFRFASLLPEGEGLPPIRPGFALVGMT